MQLLFIDHFSQRKTNRPPFARTGLNEPSKRRTQNECFCFQPRRTGLGVAASAPVRGSICALWNTRTRMQGNKRGIHSFSSVCFWTARKVCARLFAVRARPLTIGGNNDIRTGRPLCAFLVVVCVVWELKFGWLNCGNHCTICCLKI